MRVVTLLILAALGCDGPEGAPKSVPVDPTVALGDPEGMGVKWSELDGLVTSDAPALPEAFVGLELGQPETDVRAAIARIHDERLPRPQEVDIGGYRAVGAVLRDPAGLVVSALIDLDRGVLEAIDVSVPADQALYALQQAWGTPVMETDPKLGPYAVWTHPETGLRVELHQVGKNEGTIKFRSTAVATASAE